ncbi:hypothetical protein EZV62_016582 [Acer yangbiense]|uniref:Uncharacterized protein n=1 Tax=Acer yangbiense TaxID=1000413 RepID=A0A5C7HNV9_9ROSI|nr:hypothetical protein EZV62_016582 [Acer yangbiense]
MKCLWVLFDHIRLFVGASCNHCLTRQRVLDPLEVGEESVTNVPCIAAPPLYTPPSAAAVSGTIGEIGNQSQLRRSGSSVVRKSYTSDDELDELNSPLSSIFIDGSRTSPVSRRSNWISKENNN